MYHIYSFPFKVWKIISYLFLSVISMFEAGEVLSKMFIVSAVLFLGHVQNVFSNYLKIFVYVFLILNSSQINIKIFVV
jgi:hypothetical protein